MVFTKGTATITASAKSKHGRMIGPLKRNRKQAVDVRGNHLVTTTSSTNTNATEMVVASSSPGSPDTPAVTKTLFHVPTRTTAESDNNSDKDSCCGGNLDTEVGQSSKTVLDGILRGEALPIKEVVKCIHNLLAIACKDPEMRKQVLSRLMMDNAVEASNSVPAPPVVMDGTPMVNYNPHAFAISKREGIPLQPNAERQAKFWVAYKIHKAIESAGDPERQLVAVHAALKKPTNAPIASALGLAEAFKFKSKVAIDCLNSVDEIVNNPVCLL
jgi:hypothetical protein